MDLLEREIGGLTNRLTTDPEEDNQFVTVIIPDVYEKPEKRPKTTQIQAKIKKYLEEIDE